MKHLRTWLFAGLGALASQTGLCGDRLLATGGVMELEGSAGGGLTPWAFIAGLDTDKQVGVSGFCTRVKPDDYKLTSCGAAVGLFDRVELSAARQKFDLGGTDLSIRVRVLGIKVRAFGDAVFSDNAWLPQIAVGAQFKHNEDYDLVSSLNLGTRSGNGADFYVAATKVWLAGPLGRTWLVNATVRSTRGNQLGILGFGGDAGNRSLEAEGSVGAFLTDHLVLGAEYRQKPDHLSALREDDYKDVFLAWIPVKYFSVTVAYADLGTIAGKAKQRGSYVSLQGSW
ncbi:MAG: DUF3034 family protein [Pseudomonadota bacterium]